MTDNIKLRNHYENDALVLRHRTLARERITNATRADGSLNWSRLPKLLTTNPKLLKSDKGGEYLSAGLMFAPTWISGYNMCPYATYGCGTNCLTWSGHGQRHMLHDNVHNVLLARIVRTIIYMENRAQFMQKLHKELRAHVRKAHKLDATPAFRPNTTSDILWEKRHAELFTTYPDLVIYDYTAVPNRKVPDNYNLTFSRKESNEQTALDSGLNIAAVFRIRKGQPLPKTWQGREVIDGDLSDARFLDKAGVIVGLRPKGASFDDTSGFVI